MPLPPSKKSSMENSELSVDQSFLLPPSSSLANKNTIPSSDDGDDVLPVNCTVLCSTGDGGAICDCGDMPPLMLNGNSAPANCTVLCSSGDGGAACDCGDMPPAFEAVASGPHAKLPLPCSRLCAILPPDQAPGHCGCHTRRLRSPRPQPPEPPVPIKSTRLCDSLCAQGQGGSLCDCDTPNLPPAMMFLALPPPPTEIPPLPINPVINCFVLCDRGMGGSLCRCGDMPPAAGATT